MAMFNMKTKYRALHFPARSSITLGESSANLSHHRIFRLEKRERRKRSAATKLFYFYFLFVIFLRLPVELLGEVSTLRS